MHFTIVNFVDLFYTILYLSKLVSVTSINEKFSYSSLYHMFRIKTFRFPFLTKISLDVTWGVKCENRWEFCG